MINFYPKSILVIWLVLLASSTATSQQVVNGRVTDETGAGLPGATIIEKATTNGTVSDVDGRFSISVKDDAILTFSFVGYKKQEMAVDGKNTMSIQLEPDSEELDEVVVVGYGTVRKSDLTGAVAKYNTEETERYPVASVDQMLQGRISGVQITQSSGAPGAGMSFVVRGGNTLGSNQPLVILDGYPIQADAGSTSDGIEVPSAGSNPLANLNPNEIESIEILKDASSTAIYGSRGANGVIIVTTKRGKKGSSKIDFSYRADISQIRKTIDVLSTQDYMAYRNEGALSDGLDSIYSESDLAAVGDTSRNWQDEIYDLAVSHNYQLTLSGGDDKSTYNIAANYYKNNGAMKNTDFQRGGVRFNYGRDAYDWLHLNFNSAITKTMSNLGLHSGNDGLASANLVTSTLLFQPLSKPFNEFGEVDQTILNNPFTLLDLVKDERENTFLVANLKLDAKITEDLTFSVNAGANQNTGARRNYMPRGTFIGDNYDGYAFRGQSDNFNYLSEFTFSYKKEFGNHRINAVGGYTYQKWTRRFLGTSATGFINDNLTFEDLGSANAPGITNTRHSEWALASFLYRVNYSLMDKYLFTVTGRNDGSSRLRQENKWTFFPSVALAWKVSEESFMQGFSALEALKLRVSYGQSGRQSVPVGATQQFLTTDRVVIGGAIVNGLIKDGLSNPNLQWETTDQYNAGLDAAFFKNRLQLEANFYLKQTENLIIQLPVPSTTGFGVLNTNSGSIENKGMEFEVSGTVVSQKNVSWKTGGNISFNRNKMTDLGLLPDSAIITGPNYLNAGNILNQPIHVAMVGETVGSFYGYQVEGIYQSQEEINNHLGTDARAGVRPGDFRFADLDGDSLITSNDRKIIGNPQPKFVFGITNEINYQQFTLNFLIQGVIGNDVANLNRYRMDALTGSNHNVRQEAYDNRWTEENPGNIYPRASATGAYFNQRFSDFIIEDGSFVRLKNISLSYRFSKLPKGISGLNVFVTGTNLLTFSNYKGYDPEVNSNFDSGLTPGVDNGTYPQLITLSTGINISF